MQSPRGKTVQIAESYPPPNIGVPCQTPQLPPILYSNEASGGHSSSNLKAKGMMKIGMNISNECCMSAPYRKPTLNQKRGSAHVQARGTKKATHLCGKGAVLAKEPIRSFLSL